jgi:hypothetical protein
MISISRTGSMRSPVGGGRFALKFARDARGRASDLYEAKLYRSVSATRRNLLCPVLWVSRNGFVQIMRAAKPLTNMMSLDEYMHVAEVWETMPGEDSCALELEVLKGPWPAQLCDGELVLDRAGLLLVDLGVEQVADNALGFVLALDGSPSFVSPRQASGGQRIGSRPCSKG